MVAQATDLDIGPLHHGLRAARRRLWWQLAILTLARSICAALGFSLAASLLTAWQAPQPLLSWLWTAAALTPLAGLAAAILSRPSLATAARVLDARLGLWQQLGTAEELLSSGASGSLVSMQLATASALAEEVSISTALPLVPRREVAVSALLATFTGAILLAISLGITIPNPLTAIRLPSFWQEAASAAEQEVAGSWRDREALKSRSPALDPVRRTLEELLKEAQRGSISSAAAAGMLAQASADLNRIADESRIQQEALDSLASELLGTAAGREAAESLRQGDYQKAAQQLKELGRQNDQLSSAAKRELSDALNRAAARSQNAQELARSESRAAQTLQRGDYGSTVQSMDQLSKAVQDAANRTVPQSELADAWQRLEEAAEQFGGLPNAGSQGNGALPPPVAQAPGGAGERQSSLQQGSPGDGQQGAAHPDLAGGNSPEGQPGDAGGTPGNSGGGPPLGNENPRLGADGTPLDVQGKVGDRFPGEPGSSSEQPSVLREAKGNTDGSPSAERSSGPLSVPAENVFVPGDRRPIVRDYFSRGSRGQ